MAGDRARIVLHGIDEILLGYPDAVLELDCGPEIIICDLAPELFLYIRFEPEDFRLIEFQSLFALRIREVHHKDVLEAAHKFVHLLFTVACVLAHYDVTEVEERALVFLGEAVAGFDERAEIGRKVLFRGRDGLA